MADFTPTFPSSSFSLNPLAVLTESSSSFSSCIDVFEEDSCSICLEPFNTDDPATVTTCKHEYHLHCILEWLGRSKQCPVCWQLLILKDPACQELLGAIERERKSRLRKISFLAPPTLHYSRDEIQTEHGSFTVNSNVDGKMQHLANATSSNLYLSRRERHRSSRHHPSQVLVSTSLANVLAGVDNADTAASEECRLLNCGSYEGDSLASNRGRPHGVNSGPLLAIAPSSNGDTAVNGGVSINPTFLYSQSPPDLLRSTSSDVSPPSESIKSKFSAASARYKESFSKSTKNFKEKLLERNASVKELRKEVQREMSAGVTRMIKCFDHIASKRVDGESSNFNFKGKAVLEDVIAQTFNKHRGKGVDEITSDAASHTPIAAAPGGVEVSQAQSGHGC